MSSYKIPFASLCGAIYEVRIYPTAEGYDADNAIELTGGPEPFTTEEDRSTDILAPVRSSTGYIAIVTDDYTLQSRLMPLGALDMRVTLMRYARSEDEETAVMWEGYIRPQTFTQDWCGGPWEIQLPVISRLGVMMDEYLSASNTGLITIGQWLSRICGSVYTKVLIPNDELATSGTMAWGSDTLATPTVLQLAFSEEIFKSPIALHEREDFTQPWDPGTNRDIATSICTMLRWVLREQGDTLICEDPGTNAAYYLQYDASNLTEQSPTPTDSLYISEPSLEELGTEAWYGTSLGGADGTQEVLLPYGRVSLQGASGTYDTILINAADTEWEMAGGIPHVNGAPASFNRPDGLPGFGNGMIIKSQKVIDTAELTSYHYYSKQWDLDTGLVPAGEPEFFHPATSMIYKNFFPHVIQGLDYDDENAKAPGAHFGGGEVSAIHYFHEKSGSYVHYRLNSIILGKITTTDPLWRPAVTLRTTAAQLLPYSSRKNGYIALRLSGTVMHGTDWHDIDISSPCDADGFYGIQVSVKIGDTYIYKDTWGTHQCTLTSNESPFDILWTADDDNQFTEYIRLGMTDGYPMALDAPVEITIYTPSDAPRQEGRELANNCYYLRIDNFRVEVCEQETDDAYDTTETFVDKPDSGISLSERIGSNKLEEYSISTSFGGPDNPGAIMAAIPVTITGATMSMMQARKVGTYDGDNDGARYLCRRTWTWMKQQGSHVRRCLKIPLRTESQWSLPVMGRIHDADGASYLPVYKRNWRNDTTTVTLIEIINE